MSNLPFNLSSSHFSGEDIYNVFLDGDRSYWESMSDKKRAKWNTMAVWVNERTPHNLDVTALVDEMLRRGKIKIPFITPADDSADLEGIGMNIHDDDIVAAARRFLEEHNAQQEDAPTVRQQTYSLTEGDRLKDMKTPVSPEVGSVKVAETNDPQVLIAQGIDAIAALLKAILAK